MTTDSERGFFGNLAVAVLATLTLLWQSYAIHLIASWYLPNAPTTAQVFGCFLAYLILIVGKESKSGSKGAGWFIEISATVGVVLGIAWGFRFVLGVA